MVVLAFAGHGRGKHRNPEYAPRRPYEQSEFQKPSPRQGATAFTVASDSRLFICCSTVHDLLVGSLFGMSFTGLLVLFECLCTVHGVDCLTDVSKERSQSRILRRSPQKGLASARCQLEALRITPDLSLEANGVDEETFNSLRFNV